MSISAAGSPFPNNEPAQRISAGQVERDAEVDAVGAEKMQEVQQPGQVQKDGNPKAQGKAGSDPDSKLFDKPTLDAGKRWCELPGEVRSKIVQEMKAKYGEDDARMLEPYFEQLADTKRGKK